MALIFKTSFIVLLWSHRSNTVWYIVEGDKICREEESTPCSGCISGLFLHPSNTERWMFQPCITKVCERKALCISCLNFRSSLRWKIIKKAKKSIQFANAILHWTYIKEAFKVDLFQVFFLFCRVFSICIWFLSFTQFCCLLSKLPVGEAGILSTPPPYLMHKQ